MSFPRYPSYKDSGVEWLGEVPGHWEVKPLKAVTTHNDDVLDETTAPDTEIAYVDISSVDGVNGINAKESMLFSAAPSRARRRVKHGDVIVSTVRTYLRAIARIREPEDNLVVSTGFAVVRPRDALVPDFLGNVLSASYFVEQVIARSTGVSYPAINASELVAIPVTVPPKAEQTAIAAFLDRETGKIDELVAEQRRLMELLKEKRQAVISHAVTRGLNPAAPRKPSGIAWLGDVPAHWRVGKLGHASKLRGGFAFSAADFGAEGIVVVRMNNLKRGRLDLSDGARIPESSCNDGASLSDGDLILGMSGSTGETGSLGNYARVRSEDLPCQLNQRVGRFAADTARLDLDFLERVIQTAYFYEQIMLLVTGTAQFNVSSEQVQSCLVALPPVSEQREIVAYFALEIAKFDTLTAEAQRAIDLLQERRTALISAAVTGQIDVRG